MWKNSCIYIMTLLLRNSVKLISAPVLSDSLQAAQIAVATVVERLVISNSSSPESNNKLFSDTCWGANPCRNKWHINLTYMTDHFPKKEILCQDYISITFLAQDIFLPFFGLLGTLQMYIQCHWKFTENFQQFSAKVLKSESSEAVLPWWVEFGGCTIILWVSRMCSP